MDVFIVFFSFLIFTLVGGFVLGFILFIIHNILNGRESEKEDFFFKKQQKRIACMFRKLLRKVYLFTLERHANNVLFNLGHIKNILDQCDQVSIENNNELIKEKIKKLKILNNVKIKGSGKTETKKII